MTSVGEMLIAGTQVGNNVKTRRRHNRNTQKIASYVTLTKWAHLIGQSNVQSPGTHISMTRTHLSVTQSKAVAKGGKRLLAEPVDRPNPP